MGNKIIIFEKNDTLFIQEDRNGSLVTLMRVVAGAVTEAQLIYFRANVRGRIKQLEADLLLKYFYGLDIE